MSTPLESVLSTRNLCGLIKGVVSGVPADLLPPAFTAHKRGVEKNYGTYLKIEGTRKTARACLYGSAARRRELIGISEVPVTLIHSFESITHPVSTLLALLDEKAEGEMRQQLGKQTIARQLDEFGMLFQNLRVSAIYSALALGKIYFDSSGNLLPSSSGAANTVDYGVPNANTTVLSGKGSWKTASTDILGQLKLIKQTARKTTGYPIKYAFYGTNIPGYMAANTAINAMIRGNPKIAQEAISAEIAYGVGDLNWVPVDQAFYKDSGGVDRSWFSDDTVVFTPDPSPDWWEILEGSYPVPRNLNLTGDMSGALANIMEVTGPFSYAKVTDNPPALEHFGGDTFLPVLKVPAAIFPITVPTT